jgi:hypothetical protein
LHVKPMLKLKEQVDNTSWDDDKEEELDSVILSRGSNNEREGGGCFRVP